MRGAWRKMPGGGVMLMRLRRARKGRREASLCRLRPVSRPRGSVSVRKRELSSPRFSFEIKCTYEERKEPVGFRGGCLALFPCYAPRLFLHPHVCCQAGGLFQMYILYFIALLLVPGRWGLARPRPARHPRFPLRHPNKMAAAARRAGKRARRPHCVPAANSKAAFPRR